MNRNCTACGREVENDYPNDLCAMCEFKTLQFFVDALLRCPSNHKEKLFVEDIRAAESGLDHLEVIMNSASGETRWKHKIYTEEI